MTIIRIFAFHLTPSYQNSIIIFSNISLIPIYSYTWWKMEFFLQLKNNQFFIFQVLKKFRMLYIRDSLIGTLETRLSRSSIVPLTPTVEKPREASTNCDDTTVTAVDSADQSNDSAQTSRIRWEPLPRPDRRARGPTVLQNILQFNINGNNFLWKKDRLHCAGYRAQDLSMAGWMFFFSQKIFRIYIE